MRTSLLFAGVSALALGLGFGVAHANPPGPPSPGGSTPSSYNTTNTTNTTNSNHQSWSSRTANSNNETETNMAAASSGGVAANNHSLAISASLSNFANSYKTISNYHLATATTNGSVMAGAMASGGGSGGPGGMDRTYGRHGKGSSGAPVVSMNASLNNTANGTGIVTAQVNAGVNSLQQNTVALSSVVSGSSNTSVFH